MALYWRGLRPRLWVLCVECFASRTTDEIAQAYVVGICFMGIYAFVCFVFVRGALRASEIIISQSVKQTGCFFGTVENTSKQVFFLRSLIFLGGGQCGGGWEMLQDYVAYARDRRYSQGTCNDVESTIKIQTYVEVWHNLARARV